MTIVSSCRPESKTTSAEPQALLLKKKTAVVMQAYALLPFQIFWYHRHFTEKWAVPLPTAFFIFDNPHGCLSLYEKYRKKKTILPFDIVTDRLCFSAMAMVHIFYGRSKLVHSHFNSPKFSILNRLTAFCQA